MKTLLLDIETSPNLAHVWKLWDENVGLDQLRESSELLCFSAKWLGEPARETAFFSSFHHGREDMVWSAHELLDAADVVMTWNGKRFDVPHLNREFLEGGFTPPSPYKQIDLCEVVKKQFRFPSNKLDYVAQRLGVGRKVRHPGHQLWVDCMAGDPKAWKLMEKYNKRDVTLLDGIYKQVQPWVPQHPSWAAYSTAHVCPACGSDKLQSRGVAYTLQSTYRRYQCQDCGKWSRATRRVSGTTIREVAS